MDTSGIEASELPEAAAQQAISEHFIPRLSLVPMAQVLPAQPSKRLHAPAGNQAERDYEEAMRVRADLRINRMKSDGSLHRMEIDRAHRREIAMGDHS